MYRKIIDDGSTAPCEEIGQEIFYPEDNLEQSEKLKIKEICGGCKWRDRCADHGIRHEIHGYWGGLSPEERRRIRLRRKINFEEIK